MNGILAWKHWQVFIVMMIGGVCSNFEVEWSPQWTTGIRILGFMLYSIWPILVANELQQLLPKRLPLNFNFFLINTFVWLAFFFGSIIISNGEGIRITGLLVISGFYVVFAYFYSLAYPVKVLNSIEKQQVARLSQYIGDLLLISFLPLGVWFLQPRINAVLAKYRLAQLEQQQRDQNRLLEA